MIRFTPALTSLVLIAFASPALAQLLPVLHDYRQPMAYSPNDPFVKGKVFRYHTGHAGKFYNCDCEEQKRFSPYITWLSVCNRDVPRHYCQVLYCDILEVKSRIRSGACRNDSACTCADCIARRHLADSKGRFHSSQQSGVDSSGLAVDVRAEETDDHLVYGNRTSRNSAKHATAEAEARSQNRASVAELQILNPSEHLRRR